MTADSQANLSHTTHSAAPPCLQVQARDKFLRSYNGAKYSWLVAGGSKLYTGLGETRGVKLAAEAAAEPGDVLWESLHGTPQGRMGMGRGRRSSGLRVQPCT